MTLSNEQIAEYLLRQQHYWADAFEHRNPASGPLDYWDGHLSGVMGVIANAVTYIGTDGKYGDPTTKQETPDVRLAEKATATTDRGPD